MRYVVRREHFGGLVYDKENYKYFYLDTLTADLLKELGSGKDFTALSPEFHAEIDREDYNDFVEHCREIQLINDRHQLNAQTFWNESPAEDRLNAPLIVFLEVTRRCNLACQYCFTEKHRRKRLEIELDLPDFKRLFDEMSSLGVSELVIGGGEPTLRADLFEILESARENDLVTSITTNGTLVTPEIAKQFASYSLRYIRVSLDGTEETNNSLRGKGAYEKAVRGISMLQDAGNDVGLRMVLNAVTIDKIHESIEIAEHFGCKTLGISTIRPSGKALDNEYLYMLPKEEHYRAISEIMELQKQTDVRLSLSEDCPYVEGLEAKSEDFNQFGSGFGCAATKTTCSIDPFGSVSPCGFIRGAIGDIHIGGNIKEQSLKEIWDESASWRFMRSLEGNEKCNSCDYYTQCYGGCRSRAAAFYGDMNAPDPYCMYT